MRISLTVEDDTSEAPIEIVLDNRGIDNDNYITLFVGEESFTIEVREFKNALECFYKIRMDRLMEESLMN